MKKSKALPKWAGYLGAIAAIVVAAVPAYEKGGWAAVAVVVAGAITTLCSHSATGTGGK